ncbi:MAG: hypothetical protein JXA14_24485 [Anaerolineae bacterium]|nr:hypothetical protein [Anaerolineae bacterium]
MEPRARNRIETFVGIALIGLSLLVVGYLLLQWNSPQVGEPKTIKITAAPPTPSTLEMWDAYERAQAVAWQEALDAQPVSATAQWQAATEKEVLAGADDWVFTFYSPTEEQLIVVHVNVGRARAAHRTQMQAAPARLAEGRWHEGPKDALLIFLAHGGRAFMETHPEAVIDLHLGNYEGRGPAWDIVASDAENRDVVLVVTDSETMRVLTHTP